jgi:hypothetical protein
MVVRRISPNNRTIEADDEAFSDLTADIPRAMGQALVNVHLGTSDCATAIISALDQYKQDWLVANAKKMADAIERDFHDYLNGV